MRAREFIIELGNPSASNFRGNPCKKDCKGHASGYRWAARKGIKHSKNCPNNPKHPSFARGCQVFGNEQSSKL